jgi:hypothetical protein
MISNPKISMLKIFFQIETYGMLRNHPTMKFVENGFLI